MKLEWGLTAAMELELNEFLEHKIKFFFLHVQREGERAAVFCAGFIKKQRVEAAASFEQYLCLATDEC